MFANNRGLVFALLFVVLGISCVLSLRSGENRNGLAVTDILEIKKIDSGSMAFYHPVGANVYIAWVHPGSSEPVLYQVPKYMFDNIEPGIEGFDIVKVGDPKDVVNLSIRFFAYEKSLG